MGVSSQYVGVLVVGDVLDDLHFGAVDNKIDIHHQKEAVPQRLVLSLAVDPRSFHPPLSAHPLG
jgi:hypothetical protein